MSENNEKIVDPTVLPIIEKQQDEQVEKTESPTDKSKVKPQTRAGGHKVGLALELEQ